MVDKEGGPSMEDAAGFFANVFGGDRFHEYVRSNGSYRQGFLTHRAPDWRDIAHERDDKRGDDNDVR
jgi:hypothetical protein